MGNRSFFAESVSIPSNSWPNKYKSLWHFPGENHSFPASTVFDNKANRQIMLATGYTSTGEPDRRVSIELERQTKSAMKYQPKWRA